MAKLKKQKWNDTPESLKQAIANADAWVLITAAINKNNNGAEIAVRESYHTGTINMIAMLLEQPEIYDAVQAKIAQVKMMDKKNNNNSPNLNVN